MVFVENKTEAKAFKLKKHEESKEKHVMDIGQSQ